MEKLYRVEVKTVEGIWKGFCQAGHFLILQDDSIHINPPNQSKRGVYYNGHEPLAFHNGINHRYWFREEYWDRAGDRLIRQLKHSIRAAMDGEQIRILMTTVEHGDHLSYTFEDNDQLVFAYNYETEMYKTHDGGEFCKEEEEIFFWFDVDGKREPTVELPTVKVFKNSFSNRSQEDHRLELNWSSIAGSFKAVDATNLIVKLERKGTDNATTS